MGQLFIPKSRKYHNNPSDNKDKQSRLTRSHCSTLRFDGLMNAILNGIKGDNTETYATINNDFIYIVLSTCDYSEVPEPGQYAGQGNEASAVTPSSAVRPFSPGTMLFPFSSTPTKMICRPPSSSNA